MIVWLNKWKQMKHWHAWQLVTTSEQHPKQGLQHGGYHMCQDDYTLVLIQRVQPVLL